MAASSDITLAQAAERIADQAQLTALLGGPSGETRVKLAAIQKVAVGPAWNMPESAGQALQFLVDTPEVSRPRGGNMTDPVWGTAQKALLGAGLGVGAGGLASLLSKKRKKRWLRNMMLGGLLGGGVGGGFGALYHGAQSRAGGTPSGVEAEKQKGRSLLEVVDDSTPRKSTGIIGAGLGAAAGGAAGHLRHNKYEAQQSQHADATAAHKQTVDRLKSMTPAERIKQMPDAKWQEIFPKNWQAMKRTLSQATPSKDKTPGTLQQAFPTISKRSPYHMDNATWNRLNTAAGDAPAAPKSPRAPFFSRKGWAGLGGAAGALAPQLFPRTTPSDGDSPATPY